jgi:hypothetical protein
MNIKPRTGIRNYAKGGTVQHQPWERETSTTHVDPMGSWVEPRESKPMPDELRGTPLPANMDYGPRDPGVPGPQPKYDKGE